jgi:hypothetical protein
VNAAILHGLDSLCDLDDLPGGFLGISVRPVGGEFHAAIFFLIGAYEGDSRANGVGSYRENDPEGHTSKRRRSLRRAFPPAGQPDQRGTYDYLFVDEAGQVALGNLVAMGSAVANIVLVGDQMQLPQPVQGVHPGETGLSSLEHLVEDKATVPEDRGILLNETCSLHPTLCRFISDAVYDGRALKASINGKATSDASAGCDRYASAGRHIVRPHRA